MIEIEEFIAKQNTSNQKKIHFLRELITRAHPKIVESWKYKTPFYTYKGLFCYLSIEPKTEKLYVGFCNGKYLSRSELILKSDGNKEIRKFFVEDLKENTIEILEEILQEAVLVKDELKSSKPSLEIKSRRVL
jgi:hypothetical protein